MKIILFTTALFAALALCALADHYWKRIKRWCVQRKRCNRQEPTS